MLAVQLSRPAPKKKHESAEQKKQQELMKVLQDRRFRPGNLHDYRFAANP